MSDAPKYIVRRLELSDAGAFYSAVRESIDELVYWMPWCSKDYTPLDAENWIKTTMQLWEADAEYPLGIFDAVSGAVIGGTGVNHINRAYRIGNIGYWVSSRHTGQGVARFAAHHSALLGFSQLGLTRLEIVVLTHNKASQRVAESLGAKLECEARNRLYFQGKPHNALVYSLVPGDLR
ncbi:GNAT family N-acetyltransferase [Methylomonas sp. YC3]